MSMLQYPQQDNTPAQLNSLGLKSSKTHPASSLSTVNKAPLHAHFKYEGEDVKENPRAENFSDAETLGNEREGLEGRSH
jgi:hypothetical protein